MPDRRTHRGPHPGDGRLFAPEMLPRLQLATDDLCWLLGRGYPQRSALKVVGDRYELEERQRIAVSRCACSDAARARRRDHQTELPGIAGGPLAVDGYNLLTTIEAALAGGVILAARDGCYRDMASMHGTWRRVQETIPAAELIGQFLAEARVASCQWYLDRPVSNSGRLKRLLLDLAGAQGWTWQVELAANPDRLLAEAPLPVATADSAILDRCPRWVNVAAELIRSRVPEAQIIPLANPPAGG